MRRAFSLNELLVLVAVVVLLVAILVPSFGRMRGNAGESVSMSNLQTLSFAHCALRLGLERSTGDVGA